MAEQAHDMPQSHLEPHEVVAYLERTLPAPERTRIEAHLAACEDCSNEIAEVWRLWRPGARPARWLPVGLAAAAVVAAVVLLRPAGHRPERAAGDLLRGSERGSEVITVAPADSAVVQGRPVLVWRPVAGATGYRITVSREDGDSLWAGSTGDTTAAIPAGVALARSGTYFWYVDALLSDGQSLSSGLHEFKTGP